jgi:HlyD family secretion protein
VVRAPRDGRILRIVTRAGETIGPRPILELGDTDHMYATAEIYETDVRYVRPGEQATITSDALSGPLRGSVESVGSTVGKNEVVSLDPTAAADARVVLARIRLDDSREASRLVQLQVDVLIDTAQTAAIGANKGTNE